mmetsp:Transcript_42544/g.66654  ORF Transcript_42544/g.66654 Transcript_42544/m.66654 type:complete len:99 (+) Transcript_42544:267-563(+)
MSAEGLTEPTHKPLEDDDLPDMVKKSGLFNEWASRVQAGQKVDELEDVFAWIRGKLQTQEQRQELCEQVQAQHLAEVENKLRSRQARRNRCLSFHRRG